jgi:hypothetical protein
MGAFTGPQTEFGVPLTVRHPADNITDPAKVSAPAPKTETLDEQLTAKPPTTTGVSG